MTKNLLFSPQPLLGCDKQTKLEVPILDWRLSFCFVLVSINTKITKNKQKHKFCEHEGKNILSTISVAKLFSQIVHCLSIGKRTIEHLIFYGFDGTVMLSDIHAGGHSERRANFLFEMQWGVQKLTLNGWARPTNVSRGINPLKVNEREWERRCTVA